MVISPPIEVTAMMWPARRSRMCGSSLDHRHGSVDVHLELTAKVIHRRLLEEAVMAVPGVGDEHVDRAQVALGLAHDPVHRDMVRHVQDTSVHVTGERLEGPCVDGRAHPCPPPGDPRPTPRAPVRAPGRY